MLSEKLYQLRKKNGLSQEQLAEQLNVSRQAISKWETGVAVPESEKLIAISKYFNVSLDCLIKDDEEASGATTEKDELAKTHSCENPVKDRRQMWGGLVTCVGGMLGLILWGLISLFNPPVSSQISESVTFRMDGNGIFLVVCLVFILVGAALSLKNKR